VIHDSEYKAIELAAILAAMVASGCAETCDTKQEAADLSATLIHKAELSAGITKQQHALFCLRYNHWLACYAEAVRDKSKDVVH
jgi:hypothetical protein